MGADKAIFGASPLILLQDSGIYSPFLTTFFSTIYLVVYTVFPPVFAIYLYAVGKKLELSQFISAISILSILGFMLYVIVPAVGPAAYFSSIFTIDIYTGSQVPPTLSNDVHHYQKSAFPSMHTAIVTMFALFCYRFSRRLFWITLPFVLFLFASTIYLRMHYFIDLVAGWALAALLFLALSNKRAESLLCPQIEFHPFKSRAN